MRIVGRLGLLAFVVGGGFVIARPELMPHVEVPYDKFLHVGTFALATLFAVLSSRDYRVVLSLSALIMLAGIGVELFQSILPGRSADMTDAVANALGAGSVLAASYFWRRRANETPDSLIERQILDVYQRERALGRPPAACLGAAAEACRIARPTMADQDIRLLVVRLVEDTTIR